MELKFDFISLIIGIMLAIVEIYIVGNILGKNIFNKKFRVLIGIIVLALYQSIAYSITDSFIRPIVSLLTIFILVQFIFGEQISKTFISTFLTWIILLVSEICFMIIVTGIMGFDTKQIQSKILGNLLVNISIYVIAILFINIKPIRKFCSKICQKFCNIEDKFMNFLIMLLVFAFSIGTYLIYFNVEPFIAFILNLIIMIIYVIVLITLFNAKNENIKMQQNINSISENLNEYEKMLDYQRVANHENKNQLLVIKGKLKKNENDVVEYIDNIIKEERNDNEDFYEHTKRIPTGGLQGLIYYKSLSIKDKNIKLNLKINNNIKKFNFKKLSTSENSDLCKIVGVWLDNALQAVEDLDDRKIGIEMFFDDSKLTLSISNNFIGNLDVEKIQENGYTTKGTGHGYGLCLVKKILEKNTIFENVIHINGNVFTQILYIK